MKQTDRVPHKARGAAQSAGVPAERAGVPAESAGTTKTSYPLMKYLSLLLAVALLFSGVTFARYLSNDRIDASVGIAAFDATYSIDRVNSTTFGNQNYWIETGTSGDDIPQGAGSEITVGITLKNNGDTSVQPTLHFEGPKEYWDHIALQLTTARNVAAGKVLTPQLVIGDIAGAPGDSFNTASSTDYGSLGGGDPVLSLSGSIDSGLTAAWTYEGVENKMTITKKTGDIDYSVGFVRQSEDAFLPPFYVDCQKETDIYSIDLELPALNVDAAKSADGNRTAAEQRVVVWLTWTTDAPNNSQAANSEFWEAIAEGRAPTGVQDENGKDITILGYHFDQSGVPVVNKSGAATGETTTVRVKNTFGDTADALTTEYFHIASLDEAGQDSAYPHAAELAEGKKYIYLCGGPSPTYFDVENVTKTFTNEDINLIKWEEVKDAEEGDITSTTYAPVHERSFGISFKATFVQSSEVPNI
ncbi:MAG TPA: hypothetical protein H9797_02750 [Candidatus Gallimonas gallistercoris]|uniref:Uncharacterized protein n=1 Tax=Candidatus Gallimonas gallistercoris TaxID=2838602 RepID=A0A9D2KFH7_9FIRM|nr:hypothetical protein [Candidatus Gallimonas gallistercoris]